MSTIDAWHEVLRDYTHAQVSRAFMMFRAEGREHAPNISQFEAKLRSLKDEDEQARIRKALTSKPAYVKEGLQREMRTCADGRLREYVTVGSERASEVEQRMRRDGLVKSFVSLPGGRTGYTWARVGPPPKTAETAEAIKPDAAVPVLDETFDWSGTLLDGRKPKRQPRPVANSNRGERAAVVAEQTPPQSTETSQVDDRAVENEHGALTADQSLDSWETDPTQF